MELTLQEYLELSRRVIKKYAKSLLNDSENIGEVARFMMIADKKFDGRGIRNAFRVYYGKFAIKILLNKIKRKNGKPGVFTLDVNMLPIAHYTEPVKYNIDELMKYCPEKHKDTITGYFLNKMTIYELAKQENVSPQAISLRIQACTKKMKEKLDECKLTINDFIN